MRYIGNAFVIGMMAVLLVVGCAVEEAGEADESGESAELETSSTESDVITPAAGCSTTLWCNAPGSDGSVCRLSGACSALDQVNECQRETRQACGTPVCPWVMISPSGERLFMTTC